MVTRESNLEFGSESEIKTQSCPCRLSLQYLQDRLQKIANGIAIPFLSAINGIEFAFASCYTPRQLLISHLHEEFQGKTSQFLSTMQNYSPF